MTQVIMGIDPGKRGAIAVLGGELKVTYTIEQIENNKLMFPSLISTHGVTHAYIEKAQAMPGQGAPGTFSYAMNFGRILGWCEMLGVPYTLVHPRTWSTVMHKGAKASKDPKERSLEVVHRLFPGYNLVPQGCKKPHDGIVDALLIAEYGRRVS